MAAISITLLLCMDGVHFPVKTISCLHLNTEYGYHTFISIYICKNRTCELGFFVKMPYFESKSPTYEPRFSYFWLRPPCVI